MRYTTIVPGYVLSAAILLASLCRGDMPPKFVVIRPSGYIPKEVAYVTYGVEAPYVRVQWPNADGQEFREALSLECMRVVGEAFFFVDSTSFTIKKYQRAGTLSWETQPFENLQFLEVTPGGESYIVWGARRGLLSRIDKMGRLVWTKNLSSIIPIGEIEQLGIRASYGTFRNPQWTAYGLVLFTTGEDYEGRIKHLTVLLDANGDLDAVWEGTVMITRDGFIISLPKGGLPMLVNNPIVATSLKSREERRFTLQLPKDTLNGLGGDARLWQFTPDTNGGFLVYCAVIVTPIADTPQGNYRFPSYHVMWRFDRNGKLKEEWRFPWSIFAHRFPEATVDRDGSVYWLEFREKGIAVIKYGRSKH